MSDHPNETRSRQTMEKFTCAPKDFSRPGALRQMRLKNRTNKTIVMLCHAGSEFNRLWLFDIAEVDVKRSPVNVLLNVRESFLV